MKKLMILAVLLLGGCTCTVETPDTKTQGVKRETTNLVTKYEADYKVNVCVLTIEGHKYVIVGRDAIVHAESCPCKN